MRVLLDTHAVLWATLSSAKLSRRAATLISASDNDILVSSASAWEIATKVRLGKLPQAEQLEMGFLEHMARAGYTVISIDPSSALRAGRLSGDHGDPFDRMIAAQALEQDIPVISNDAHLDMFGVRRIW
jgi:PIN domain nuclease of toxin-antitoxin system